MEFWFEKPSLTLLSTNLVIISEALGQCLCTTLQNETLSPLQEGIQTSWIESAVLSTSQGSASHTAVIQTVGTHLRPWFQIHHLFSWLFISGSASYFHELIWKLNQNKQSAICFLRRGLPSQTQIADCRLNNSCMGRSAFAETKHCEWISDIL